MGLRPCTAVLALAPLLGVLACTARNPAYQSSAGPLDDAGQSEQAPPAPDAAVPQVAPIDASPTPDAPARDAQTALDSTAADSGRAGVTAAPDARIAIDLQATIDAPSAPSGLVARWRLDPGSTVIVDDLGANNGMLGSGAGWSAGPVPSFGFADPGALTLDGLNSAATLGTATLPHFEQAKSVSLWFHIDAPATVLRATILALADPAGSQSIQFGLDEGKAAVWTWSSPYGSDVVAAPSTAAPGWHHLGYTFDGETHTFYLGGISVGTSTHPGGTGPIHEALLGTYNVANDHSERFAGLIDDVRVYNRALTANEIAALAAGAP